MGIHIEINKEVNNSGSGGYVSIYASMPHAIGILEAQRFQRAFGDLIDVAIRWQEGNVYAKVRPDPEPKTKRSDSEPSVDPVGSKGGNARAKALSPARRSEIARNAAISRWSDTPAQEIDV